MFIIFLFFILIQVGISLGGQRVNAFVGCRITSPEVIRQKEEVDEVLLSRDKNFATYMEPSDRLHVTLDVYSLQERKHWDEANQAMDELAMELCYFKDNLTISFNGTNHFGSQVLYGQLDETAANKFTRIHGIVRKRFALHNIATADKWPSYHPHMTLVELPVNETKLGDILVNTYAMLHFEAVEKKINSMVLFHVIQEEEGKTVYEIITESEFLPCPVARNDMTDFD